MPKIRCFMEDKIVAYREGSELFESLQKQNGHTFWWASNLQEMLGYTTDAFQKVINRAVKLFATLDIPFDEHIEAVQLTDSQGNPQKDYKLTRFACLMIVMQADARKPEVAKYQLVLATQARLFQIAFEQDKLDFERLVIRDDIKESNKSLSSIITQYGGALSSKDYAMFHNAGYLGMYNMSQKQLMSMRGIQDSKKIYDRMGRTELAANYFRITQTEERIKAQGCKTINQMSETHKQVGQEVRDFTIRSSGGIPPEQMPQEIPLPEMKRSIKQSKTQLEQIDKKKKRK